MNILIGGTLYSSRYEYDLLRVLALLRGLYDQYPLSVSQLDEALRRLCIDPGLLYADLLAGYETAGIRTVVQALALPSFSPSSPASGGYWEQRLIEMAKLDGRSQEVLDRIDTDLENTSVSMSSVLGHFVGKEEIARFIVELNESVQPGSSELKMDAMQAAVDASKQLMQLPNLSNSIIVLSGLDNEGNTASETIDVEANSSPVYSTNRYRVLNNPATTDVTAGANRTARMPYYAKNKYQHWKKR